MYSYFSPAFSFPTVDLSLCGGLQDFLHTDTVPHERFIQYSVSQADFAINAAAILSDQKLVLRINDR